jgi:hypothetical protein
MLQQDGVEYKAFLELIFLREERDKVIDFLKSFSNSPFRPTLEEAADLISQGFHRQDNWRKDETGGSI